MFMRGQLDAKRYYREYKSAGSVSFVSGLLLGPIFGAIPTIIFASTPPERINMGYPSESLMNNHDYALAYADEAHRIKRHKSWLNYSIGLGISVAFTLALLALVLAAY